MTQTPHIDPPEFTASAASQWKLRNAGARPSLATDLRNVLGIAPLRPVIMTGHQAGFWHCGILAKTLAASACAAHAQATSLSTGPAQLVHIVVDQDDNDAGLVEYPSRDASGAIAVRQWRFAPQVEGMPTGLRPAVRAGTAPVDGARDFINQGLAEIASALRAQADQPSLAMQAAHAAHDIIAARCPGAPAWHVASALAISRSHAFAHFAEMMVADPRTCVEAYNQAAREFPAAGVRPLALHDDDARFELPIWRLAPSRSRVSARVGDVRAALDHSELTSLAPKALLMTLLLRAFACDLFVHGTGGGVYDKVMERWLSLWKPDVVPQLAPAVVATATVRLPLLDAPVPSEGEVARARWLAHAARHNPSVLEDGDAAARKALLLANVRGGTRVTRLAAYKALHEAISHYRTTRAPDIRRLADEAARLADLRAGAGPALRRTWAFPLCTRDAMDALQHRAHQWFAGT